MTNVNGIPFKNIINGKIVKVSQTLVHALYHDQMVTFIRSGWGELYHVIAEDGNTKTAVHEIMDKDLIKEQFNIDIEKYNIS